MDITMQQEQALGIARMLVKAGVPLFLAFPDAGKRSGWALPFGWESTEPDPEVVDAWRPGMALCAVTGHTFDLIDIDPRSGGTESDVPMPHSYLTAETPSGGRHHFVKTLGVPSLDGKVAPGVDVKSGTLEGEGRGFAFIAPTVRASKVDGVPREYRWVLGPKGPVLPTPDQLAGDGSGALLRARVLEIRRATASATPRRVGRSQAEREWNNAIERLRTNVAHWQLNGWGGEAHSTILATTTALARLDADNAAEAFVWAFRAAGAEPDADDMAKMESALTKAVPDVIVPDHELSFWDGGDRPPALGGSLPEALGGAVGTSALGLFSAEAASSATGRRRFQPMSRADAASIVPPETLIEGLLFTDTKARIAGPSTVGKTWVVLDMAAHVAAGMAWQGRAVRKSRVLYVAGEGAPSFDQRVKAWETKHRRAAEIDLVPEAVQIATQDWEEFALEIREQDYGLLIFDTQGSMTIGLEENSNKDANLALGRIDAMRKLTHACILLVHHTGHEEAGRARGASAWLGGLDTELILSGSVKDGLQLKPTKQKYVELGKGLRMRMEASGGGLVLTPPVTGAQGSAAEFFAGVQESEASARVQALVDKIDRYYEAGGQSKPTVRALVQVLRTELNVKGRNEDLRAAAQRYTARCGMPVDLGDDDV